MILNKEKHITFLISKFSLSNKTVLLFLDYYSTGSLIFIFVFSQNKTAPAASVCLYDIPCAHGEAVDSNVENLPGKSVTLDEQCEAATGVKGAVANVECVSTQNRLLPALSTPSACPFRLCLSCV